MKNKTIKISKEWNTEIFAMLEKIDKIEKY